MAPTAGCGSGESAHRRNRVWSRDRATCAGFQTVRMALGLWSTNTVGPHIGTSTDINTGDCCGYAVGPFQRQSWLRNQERDAADFARASRRKSESVVRL